MLQATHGVVTGSRDFFLRAFGSDIEEFERLLALPHAFIFQRDFYENGDGQSIRDDYDALLTRASKSQRAELIDSLCAAQLVRPRREGLKRLIDNKSKPLILRHLARFHAIDTSTRKVTDIANVFPELAPDHLLPEPDALVEDAGLHDPIDPIPGLIPTTSLVSAKADD